MVYLRVTAEGCGDNGQALNDAPEPPQVNSLHPGACDYAVSQRGQHYLQHQQRKEQRDTGGEKTQRCWRGGRSRRNEEDQRKNTQEDRERGRGNRVHRAEITTEMEAKVKGRRKEGREGDTALLEG